GCSTPARSCQLDHIQPWHYGGITSTENLAPFCQRDHITKTLGAFHPTHHGNGTFTWTTPTGHPYHRAHTGHIATHERPSTPPLPPLPPPPAPPPASPPSPGPPPPGTATTATTPDTSPPTTSPAHPRSETRRSVEPAERALAGSRRQRARRLASRPAAAAAVR